MKQKPNYLIVKHNDLVEARYKLTLCEQKLVLSIVMMIKPDDNDFYKYQMPIREFMNLMEVDGEGYHTRVRQKAKELLQKPIVIKRDTGGELICNWFASIEHENGQMFMCFAPELKPYLFQLQNQFTAYKSDNVMQLQSKFSIRLYELLKQYQKIGERIITLIEFRLMLGIEDGYNFADIKRRILDYCKTDIEERSDIRFEYEPIKTGRKVTAIKFLIAPNEKTETRKQQAQITTTEQHVVTEKQSILDTEQQNPSEEQAILDKVPPSLKKVTNQALKNYGVVGVGEILTHFSQQIEKGNVVNEGGLLRTCLVEGYGVRTQDERILEQKQRDQEQKRQERVENLRRQAAEQAAQEIIKKEQIKAARVRQDALLESLSDAQLAELRLVAMESLPSNLHNAESAITGQMRNIVEEWWKAVYEEK